MFAFAVLTLNFLSLAGIVVGLVLRSNRIRSAIEAAYVYSDDAAARRIDPASVETITWAVIRTAILNSNESISLRKILLVSFLSSTLFGMTIGPLVGEVTETSPATMFFGGGAFGLWMAISLKYLLAWPGHFIYDYLVCLVLLRVARTGHRRSLGAQFWLTGVALLALTFVPIVVLLAYFLFRFYLPDVSTNELTGWDAAVVGVPFFWTGPSLFWIGLVAQFSDFQPFSSLRVPHILLFLLSSVASAATAFFDLLARSLANSPRAMRSISNVMLRLSTADAEKVFAVSLTTFAIGNGLCQVFGISVKVEW